MTSERTTVHIAMPTKEERELLRLLTPAERLAAMVDAARAKALHAVRSSVRSSGHERTDDGSTGQGTAGI